VAPVDLQLFIFTNQIIFSWPVSASGFVLGSAHDECSPGHGFETNGIVISGDYFVVTEQSGYAAGFYRLHR